MARRRASMREGPLAELFRATEAAQLQGDPAAPAEPAVDAAGAAPAPEVEERTVEHIPSWEEATQLQQAVTPAPPSPGPDPMPDPLPPPGPSPSPDPAPVPGPPPPM